MPRSPLSEEQLTEFRARAVEVAMRLFAEQGYAAVTMRALAAELGVSAMTPYRYFENKEQLFDAVRAEAFRRLADHQRVAARRQREPLRKLSALCDSYVQFALSEPNAYRIMFSLHDEAQGASDELQREQARSFSYLLAAVEEAVAARLVYGDPLTTAHLFWSQAHGLVSLELAGKLHMGRSLRELCEAFIAGLVDRAQRSKAGQSGAPTKRSRRKA